MAGVMDLEALKERLSNLGVDVRTFGSNPSSPGPREVRRTPGPGDLALDTAPRLRPQCALPQHQYCCCYNAQAAAGETSGRGEARGVAADRCGRGGGALGPTPAVRAHSHAQG